MTSRTQEVIMDQLMTALPEVLRRFPELLPDHPAVIAKPDDNDPNVVYVAAPGNCPRSFQVVYEDKSDTYTIQFNGSDLPIGGIWLEQFHDDLWRPLYWLLTGVVRY